MVVSPRSASVWELLKARVATQPDARFVVDERGVELTVADVHDRALLVAGALVRDHGVRRGVVVSWQLPNWLDSIVLSLALCRLQAVQNPIVPIFREREVGFITTQAGSRLLLVAEDAATFDHRAMAERAAGRVAGSATGHVADGTALEVLSFARDGVPSASFDLPEVVDEPAETERWLFYTSGTTADPKGARHTDASLIAAAGGMAEALAIDAHDRVATLLPLAHIGGVIRIVTGLLTGATILISAVFDPQRSIPFLRAHGATLVPGAMPFLHAAFDYQVAHPDLDPLFPAARALIHGGSPKPPALHVEAKRRLGTVGVVSGYGMTECPMSVWNRPSDSDDDLANTEGTPTTGVELRITGATGDPLPPGTEGEVRIKGPQLMLGYVDPALDADAFDAEGFVRSGDLGVRDARGRLTITGRLKDVIIRNMENISATELENVLHQHPAVQDVAVIGLPHEATGELACAVVVPTDPARPPTLRDLCDHLRAAGLSTRKFPERLELVPALPRNAMDKVQKADLRLRFGGTATNPTATNPTATNPISTSPTGDTT